MSGRAFTITISFILFLTILFVMDWPVSIVDNVCGGTSKNGEIGTETWDVAGSPYWIEGNVTVIENETLTIEPGVEVRFNGYYKINVEGCLYSVGSPTNRIAFTSNKTSPLKGDWIGIYINLSGHGEFSYSNITYAEDGIYLDSPFNVITNNNISSNKDYGIYLDGSHFNDISNNILYSNGVGIYSYWSLENDIKDNYIYENQAGIIFWGGRWNKVVGNFIVSNTKGFLKDFQSFGNEIYFNNFIENINQTWDPGDDDWDNGSVGNYWSDYDGVDGNNDGIGDTPYIIDSDSRDNYPLMYIYPDTYPPIINLESPDNNSIVNAGTIIDISVYDPNLKEVEYSINGNEYSPFIFPFDIATNTWQDGYYTIKVKASDTSGKKNSCYYFIEIDSIKPTISLNSPENNSVIKAGTTIDLSILDSNLDIVNFTVNNDSVNPLYNPLYYPYNIYTNNWLDDIYNIKIHASDRASNNNSKSYTFMVDSTFPSIMLISPTNNSLIQPGTLLKFEISDNNLKEVNYSIDKGIHQSFSVPFEISTFDWADGIHILEIFAEDSAGNEKEAFYVFTIDSIPPKIKTTFPIKGNINIPINTSIIIIFSESMNISSVESAISIIPYKDYSCSWGNDNKTLFLIFPEPLAYNTLHKIIIGTNSEDLVGHKLENPYELEFTTEKKPKKGGYPFIYIILILLLVIILVIIIIVFIIIKTKKYLKG